MLAVFILVDIYIILPVLINKDATAINTYLFLLIYMHSEIHK